MENMTVLPPNFHEEIIYCESEFQSEINENNIRKLIYVYTLGMQYYNLKEKSEFENYYKNKLNKLLLDENVIKYLDTHKVDLTKKVDLNIFPKESLSEANKEIGFMKLTDLEHKYDDLQNKIDDIINKQNALAESKEKNESEENIKLNDENKQKMEEEKNIKENNIIKEEQKDEGNKIIYEEKKIIKNEEKSEKNNIEINDKNNVEQKIENKEKKETKAISALERLNKLKEKKEKIQKLNLSEIIGQTYNNNNA